MERRWTRMVQDRSVWRTFSEAHVLQWTSIDWYDDDDNDLEVPGDVLTRLIREGYRISIKFNICQSVASCSLKYLHLCNIFLLLPFRIDTSHIIPTDGIISEREIFSHCY